MRKAPALMVLLCLATAGCVQHAADTRPGAAFAFGAPARLPVETPSGFAVYRVTNVEGNVSLYSHFRYEWDATRFNPLQITVLLDNGGFFVPHYARTEHDPRSEGATYVGRGQEQHEAAEGGGHSGRARAEGVQHFFTNAKGGWVVLTWADLTDEPIVTFAWAPGTVMTKAAEGTEVVAARLADMRGGTRASVHGLVRAGLGDAVAAGGEGQAVFAVVKIGEGYFAHGTLTVTDERGERAIPLPSGGFGARFILTAAGETELRFDAAGDGFNAFVVAAALPPGILPDQVLLRQGEYSAPAPRESERLPLGISLALPPRLA